MNRREFHYDLPGELIAQTPIADRELSRLLCLDRSTGSISHGRFNMLPGLLRSGDCLVLNDTRVLPGRLLGRRDTGGAAEIVLLREKRQAVWECLARPGKRIRPGTKLTFGDGELTAVVTGAEEDGLREARFECDGDFRETLERLGKIPIPPYIREEPADRERYQTVYSKVSGSAAAPTAGLHFTERLLEEAEASGILTCRITLHVGLGTFRPVKADIIEEHRMHSESYTVSAEAADTINRARQGGGRVIAVGTTSCRTLETCAGDDGTVSPESGSTGIFIYPGYRFKCIDGLITNFHLPESTLIMLVSAFAGMENTRKAYAEAIRERYMFYSFGDAMLII